MSTKTEDIVASGTAGIPTGEGLGASPCYAGHVGSYDDKGLFVPDGMEEFVATLGKLNYDQLATVAAQCIHRMQELGRHNTKDNRS